MNRNLVTSDYVVFIVYFIIVASYGIWIYRRKKNPTFNLSKYGGQIQHILFFTILGSRKMGKIIKNKICRIWPPYFDKLKVGFFLDRKSVV